MYNNLVASFDAKGDKMKFIVFAFITVLGLGMFTGCTGSVDSDDSGLTQ